MALIERLAPHAERDAPPIPVLLARIGRQAGRVLAEVMEPTMLRPRHVAALSALRDAPLSQAALAEAAEADAATLVGILNDLESNGLVCRRRDAADRRRHNVAITEIGAARLAAVDAALDAVAERFLAGLDRAQRAELTALLLHVAGNALGGDACPSTAGDRADSCATAARETTEPGCD